MAGFEDVYSVGELEMELELELELELEMEGEGLAGFGGSGR